MDTLKILHTTILILIFGWAGCGGISYLWVEGQVVGGHEGGYLVSGREGLSLLLELVVEGLLVWKALLAEKPVLGHFGDLGLALLNDVHANLHPTLLLLVTEVLWPSVETLTYSLEAGLSLREMVVSVRLVALVDLTSEVNCAGLQSGDSLLLMLV
jgi:hypothetical protein